MSIEAVHRANRVELLFIVRRDLEPDAWQVQFPIQIEPGESLSSVGRAITELVTLG